MGSGDAILVEALGIAARLRDAVPSAKAQRPDENETWGHALLSDNRPPRRLPRLP